MLYLKTEKTSDSVTIIHEKNTKIINNSTNKTRLSSSNIFFDAIVFVKV